VVKKLDMRANLKQAPPPQLRLDSDVFTPYYQQIVDQVRALVKSGSVKEGDVFYSEGEVAKLLGISKMPVRQAFSKLRAEGLLVVERGKKPIVGSERVPWDFRRLHGFSEEMKRRGLESSNKVLSLVRIPAEAEIAQALRIDASDTVYRLERLYYVSGDPVAIVTSYLSAALFPKLEDQALENASLYGIFEKVYKQRLKWAEEEIGAVTASRKHAAIMGTKPNEALLFIRETTFDVHNTPIEYSESLLRADRYTVTVKSIRQR
jgi:GntR family transcriptional regulator